MHLPQNPGRRAGLLYILGSIPAAFGLIYVPGKLFAHGDPTATAHNLAAHETLFRLGILADLAGQATFIFVAIALYFLLKSVNQRQAMLMMVLLITSVPLAFFAEINSLAALTLAQGADFLSPFDEPHRIVLMRLFLNLRAAAFDVAAIFWGLWLFPLGLLVYRSRFIPRVLGVLLIAACFSYLANSATALLFPHYEAAVSRWASPIQSAEILFMLWLAIAGAKPKPASD